MRFLNNIKLRNKLLISYGSLMIVAVIVVSTLTYQKTQSYIYEQSSKSYSQTLEQVVMNIEYKMRTNQERLYPYITNHKFIAALNTTYSSPADYSYQYLDSLRAIFDLETRYPEVKNIIVYKRNDSLPDIGTYPDKPTISDIEHTVIDMSYAEHNTWYKEHFMDLDETDLSSLIALSNKTIWTVNDSRTLVTIIKPILYKVDKLVGIVEMQLKADDIFRESLISEDAVEELFYLMNVDGEIQLLSHSDLTPTADSHERIMLAGHHAGSWLAEDEQIEKLILYRTNPSIGWIYVLEIPLDSLKLNVQSFRNFTALILASCILISILLAFAISRVLTRRMSFLTMHMERQEDLTLEMGPSIDGRDEIGLLTRSYNRMIKRIQELIEQLRRSQQLQKESEIKSLQAQINPHFLYNTLATINWMAADNESKKISDMVNNLAIFYRLSLNMGKEYLSIREEISHVRAYLDIQKIRMEEKISVAYEIDEAILPYYTLKLILQPFVENAILHGAEHKAGPTHIIIKGSLSAKDNSIILEVIDDGVGMKAPVHNQYVNHGGYGIHNVNEKIQLQYGHAYGVKLYSEPGKGTRVVIRIPIITQI